jgi:hypothetical protein
MIGSVCSSVFAALLAFAIARSSTLPGRTPVGGSLGAAADTVQNADSLLARCMRNDAQNCLEYGKIAKEKCGPSPTTPGDADSAYLKCMRKAQCIEDRAIAIQATKEACADEFSPMCTQAKFVRDRITPARCDSLAAGVLLLRP